MYKKSDQKVHNSIKHLNVKKKEKQSRKKKAPTGTRTRDLLQKS
jgi:hypothetical protein